MSERAPVTLDTCATEPIHIPGAIQPHGVLFACRGPELRVVQVSANVGAMFGGPGRDVASEHLLGKPLAAVFQPESAARLAAAFAEPARLAEKNPLRVVAASGTELDAVLHVATSGQLVVECEPIDPATGGELGFDPRLRSSTRRLQQATARADLYAIAAEEVRAVTGFDRVMVYRFDRKWNGEVVAEARRDDLEPFLGLHYPASDIPEQARRLYTINWLRFIVDVHYRPAPVLPVLDATTNAPLDMSFGILRSVSPIHIEYLKNMGVSASMSVSLVIDGVLVGLIACHHYSGPRLVPFRARETCEYLARTLSWHIAALERVERSERAKRCAEHETAVVRSIGEAATFLDGLATPALVALAEGDGAVVLLAEGTRKLGHVPHTAQLAQLVDWLIAHDHDVYATDELTAATGIACAPHAGMLAVAISRTLREYLLWFRVEREHTVDWAGDPRKVEVAAPAGALGPDGRPPPPRLSPRGSFALWREVVRGTSAPWGAIAIEAASNLRRTLLSGVRVRAAELASYNQRLLDADRAKDDFIATVSHELRTPLNAIVGWSHLLSDAQAPSPERVRQGIEVIERNARAQAQIVDDLLDVSRMVSGKLSLDLATVDLQEIVADVLASIEVGVAAKGLKLVRVLEVSTARVLGDATRLRQVIANLVNNAVKFTPRGGSVRVALRRDESELELLVTDTGQGIDKDFLPLVFDVFRQADSGLARRAAGLGLGLAIAKKLVELHGGRITAESEGPGRGATFRLRLPVASVKLSTTPRELAAVAVDRPLAGVAILVVEDERDSREFLVQVLGDAGAVCTQVGDAHEALAALATGAFACVVSDIGLPGMDGLELLRELRRRPTEQGGALPAVALTAYTRVVDRNAALAAGFDAHLGKPVEPSELLAVVKSVVVRSRRMG